MSSIMRESNYERENRIREEREQEEYWEEQRYRRIMDERRREEDAQEDRLYEEQAQWYYLCQHLTMILGNWLKAQE
jgi:putative hemolysin